MSNSRNEPLAVAVQKNDVGEVTRLLSEGRSVSERFHFRRTPLHLASESGATHCIRLLIERGADIDAHDEAGHTPLICALQAGHTEPATLLLAAGARLHYVFNPEDTPEIREQLRETYRRLDDESRKAHPEIYRVLNDALADTDRRAFDAEMAESLVRASVSSRDIYTVHHCCNLQTLELVAKQPGVSLNVQDGTGYWPLKTFAEEGNAEVLAWLLNHGAAPDFTSTGDTALHASVARNHLECARLLLQAGANPNQQDVDGCVPMWSVESDAMLDLLLAHGADVNISDQCGLKPSHWIKESKLKARLIALEKEG